jgi:hypothetical protein
MSGRWVHKLSVYLDNAWTYLPERNRKALARWLLLRFVVMLGAVVGSAVAYVLVQMVLYVFLQIWNPNNRIAYEIFSGLITAFAFVFVGYFVFAICKFAIKAIRHIFRKFD